MHAPAQWPNNHMAEHTDAKKANRGILNFDGCLRIYRKAVELHYHTTTILVAILID